MNYFLNQAGAMFRIDYGADISSATLEMIFQPQSGKSLIVTPTVGLVDIPDCLDPVYFNQYTEYLTISTDLYIVGRWRFKLKVSFSTTDIAYTQFKYFEVLP